MMSYNYVKDTNMFEDISFNNVARLITIYHEGSVGLGNENA